MKAALISLGSVSSKLTAAEMEKLFDVVDQINIKEVEVKLGNTTSHSVTYLGKPLLHYDCVYVKGSYNYATIARAITSHLSKSTYLPTSEEAFTNVHDKILTHIQLQKAGIMSPATYVTPTASAAKSILKTMNYPIIMKFPSGTQGKGVMFAESYAAASSILDALDSLKQPFLIQEYIETNGSDIRVLVVGNKVVAAYKRKAQANEKRSNIHAGGTGERTLASPAVIKIAIETAQTLGVGICGVDILEGPKGPVVIEANLSPGLQGITSVTGINIAEHIAHFLYEKASEFKNGKKKISATQILNEMNACEQTIISALKIKAQKIILPEIITKTSGFADGEEVQIEVKKSKVTIKKN